MKIRVTKEMGRQRQKLMCDVWMEFSFLQLFQQIKNITCGKLKLWLSNHIGA